MTEDILSAFLFLEVRARRSGRVVELLRKEYKEIVEVAAVYSETDVIARVSAPKGRLGEILLELMQGGIPVRDAVHGLTDRFELYSVRPHVVRGAMSWGPASHEASSPEDILAYVLIDIEERYTVTAVTGELKECEGIVYVAGLATSSAAIAKVRTEDKVTFDRSVMDQIQSVPGVQSTRSFLVVNRMYNEIQDLRESVRPGDIDVPVDR